MNGNTVYSRETASTQSCRNSSTLAIQQSSYWIRQWTRLNCYPMENGEMNGIKLTCMNAR